jgi:hypothetical protein
VLFEVPSGGTPNKEHLVEHRAVLEHAVQRELDAWNTYVEWLQARASSIPLRARRP